MNKRLIMIGMFFIVIPQLKFYAMEPEKNEQPKAPGTEPGVSKVPGSVPDAVKLTTMTGAKVPGGKSVEPVKKTTSFSFGKPVEPVKVVDSSNKGGLDLKKAQPEIGQDVYDPNRDSFSGVENKSDFNEVQPKNEFEEASKIETKSASKVEDESKAKVDGVEKPLEFKSPNSPPLKLDSLGNVAEYALRIMKNACGFRTKMQKNAVHESKQSAKAKAEQQARDVKMKSTQSRIAGLEKSITSLQQKLIDNQNIVATKGSRVFADTPEVKAARQQLIDIPKKITEYKTTIGTKSSELTSLQKESGIEITLTPEQNRQQVIEGVRKIMADGSLDATRVYLKSYAQKIINADGVTSLKDRVTELNSLKENLNEATDQDIIDQINSVAKLLDGLCDTSVTGLVTTAAHATQVYTSGAYDLFFPTGADFGASVVAAPSGVSQSDSQQKIATA